MLHEGALAPEFTLRGVTGGEFAEFDLSDAIAQDHAILLLFYPFDFSPVCTNELCAIRDAEFFQLTPDVEVWAISADSAYAHRAFADQYALNFPLLSDSDGEVAMAYDVCYEEWERHSRVPKRATYLIGPEQDIRYAWATDQAYEVPDFFPVKEALDILIAERADFGYDTSDLTVEYTKEVGEMG